MEYCGIISEHSKSGITAVAEDSPYSVVSGMSVIEISPPLGSGSFLQFLVAYGALVFLRSNQCVVIFKGYSVPIFEAMFQYRKVVFLSVLGLVFLALLGAGSLALAFLSAWRRAEFLFSFERRNKFGGANMAPDRLCLRKHVGSFPIFDRICSAFFCAKSFCHRSWLELFLTPNAKNLDRIKKVSSVVFFLFVIPSKLAWASAKPHVLAIVVRREDLFAFQTRLLNRIALHREPLILGATVTGASTPRGHFCACDPLIVGGN